MYFSTSGLPLVKYSVRLQLPAGQVSCSLKGINEGNSQKSATEKK